MAKTRYDMVVDLNEYDKEELNKHDDDGVITNNAPMPAIDRSSMASRIRISTVDNFQGEEADIVIVSMVRNNRERDFGFLMDANRANVMLSRARCGMYVLGDIVGLARKDSAFWSAVLRDAQDRSLIMDKLVGVCPIHKSQFDARSADDFELHASLGGCRLPCNFRLRCGHVCRLVCHAADRAHESSLTKCDKQCEIPCARGHPCRNQCPGMRTSTCQCREPVGVHVLPQCGHTSHNLMCFELDELDKVQCNTQVMQKMAVCGHDVMLTCSTTNIARECNIQIKHTLGCGHESVVSCSKWRNDGANDRCLLPCGRPRPDCTHLCNKPCGHLDQCGRCEEPCEKRCVHSQCRRKCFEACDICVEACANECAHVKCTTLCGLPCVSPVCHEKCKLMLKCSHHCRSLCGEICPLPEHGCDSCVPANVQDDIVDLIDLETTFHSAQVPLITLPCGHSFTTEFLDGHVGFNQAYDDNGIPIPFVSLLRSRNEFQVPRCPKCRGAMYQVKRYARIFKRLEIERLSEVFARVADGQATALEKRVMDAVRNVGGQMLTKEFKAIQREAESLLRLESKDPLVIAQRATAAATQTVGPKIELVDVPLRDKRWMGTCLVLSSIGTHLTGICAIDGVRQVAGKIVECLNLDRSLAKVVRRFKMLGVIGAIKKISGVTNVLLEYARRVVERATSAMNGGGEASPPSLVLDFVREMEESLVNGEMVAQVLRVALKEFQGHAGWNEQGHLFQCPNGHYYVIGECGGAMETSHCPECGAVIGGRLHALHSTNRPASLPVVGE